MPRISLAINTRNEERKIAAAISSCQGVDEVVVADMESTDGTVEICQNAGARVLRLPNYGYCEPGRQTLVDATQGDWVLVLDADERLSAEGVERLRHLAAHTPAHVSAYLIPRPTYLGPIPIRATGWQLQYERHPRFFRRGQINWPVTIHSVPTFEGAVIDLPPGVEVEIQHECFEDLTHAWGKFNSYSGVEAQELHAAHKGSTWLSGLFEGIQEFNRRYTPEVDGGASLALSFGLFFYRLGVHLKNLELSGSLADEPVPAAQSLRSAWDAFLTELREQEVTRHRRDIGELLHRGDTVGAGERLNMALATWGDYPDLVIEGAVYAARVGAVDQAYAMCDKALAQCPGHPEARSTRLALDVATGRRPPVKQVLIGTDVSPRDGELVVTPSGTDVGDLESPLDNLPFAPGSLERVRICSSMLRGTNDEQRNAIIGHLRDLLEPSGSLEFVGSDSPHTEYVCGSSAAGI